MAESRGSASPGRGILYSLLGGFLLTANDAVLKWLTGDYPVGQLLFFRGLFVLAAISIIVWRSGGLEVIRIKSFGDSSSAPVLLLPAGFCSSPEFPICRWRTPSPLPSPGPCLLPP